MNTVDKILVKIADLSFFQIEVEADILIDGKLYENQKVRNNNSILTPDNWEVNVQVFFEQRMSSYKESYTMNEKIEQEVEILEKLPINSQDYKILKSRYIEYLFSQRSIKANLKEKKQGALDEPKSFEEIFYNPSNAKICLDILKSLERPILDSNDNYIGNAKGVFPIWIKVLQSHQPNALIKPLQAKVYKDFLNQRVKGLKLTADASEFRKNYKRIYNSDIELEMKTILSQLSHEGKLGN